MTLMQLATVFYFLSYTALFKTEAYVLQGRQKMSNPWNEEPSCSIHKNEALHDVLDRVCLMCHEMFSHEHPNMRAECRKNCFNNNKFRDCLSIFAPKRLKVTANKHTQRH
ncbi:hypothetical protein L596_026943 [Steinernema carpocapsae]|uniref:Uncharacterized protein n=1 Tax=Steinernema carpocapsae TaxID=34508 RepID=A0A4U5M305_STECR|nr:hypothetical protein L596_026943 [Steinernema carpocapsae]